MQASQAPVKMSEALKQVFFCRSRAAAGTQTGHPSPLRTPLEGCVGLQEGLFPPPRKANLVLPYRKSDIPDSNSTSDTLTDILALIQSARPSNAHSAILSHALTLRQNGYPPPQLTVISNIFSFITAD